MAKTRGKPILLSILLALCLTLFIGAVVACDNNPDNSSVDYTVTVKLDDDTPAQGVAVTIKKGSASFDMKMTDANGKVTFSLASDSYEVELSKLPSLYSAPTGAITLTPDNRNITVTLDRTFTYSVSLVNEDGSPFYADGVFVAICTLDGNCLMPEPLGADGTVDLPAEKGDYHVKVSELPDGYTYECDSDGYYTGEYFSATKTTMTIPICSIEALDLAGTPMTKAELETFAKDNLIYGLNSDWTVLSVQDELVSGGMACFSVTPAISGKYQIYHSNNQAADGSFVNYCFDGNTFTTSNSAASFPQYVILKADTTYYFRAVNNTSETLSAQILISIPSSSYIEHNGVAGTASVSVGADANDKAVIAFNPTQAASYRLTVQGDTKTVIVPSVYEPSEDAQIPSDAEFTTGSTVTAKFTPDMVGGTLFFAVWTDSDKVESFNIKFEKIANITNTVNVIDAGTLTQFDNADDRDLIGIPMDGSAELEFNETDGYYYYNGNLVVVSITGNFDTMRMDLDSSLAYIDMNPNTNAGYVLDVTSNDDAADLTKGKTFNDYRKFLRGFDNYDETQGMQGTVYSIPKSISTEFYYAKFVNDDGVYPLTQALFDFLHEFYEANANLFYFNVAIDTADGCGWLFPCYYYGETAPADAIVGTYNFVSLYDPNDEKTYHVGDDYSGNALEPTDFRLVVNKNGTFVIQQNNSRENAYEEYESGRWSKNDNGEYTFTSFWETYTVTYDETEGTITFKDDSDFTWFVFEIPTQD